MDKPLEKILVESEEVTPDILSTIVTRRENAIDDAMLIAIDTAGKEYLATLNLGDEVEIQYQWSDDPEPVWVTVFKGNIVDLNPNMSRAGETCSASAYGKGAPLKNMRVATEYGTQSKNQTINTIRSAINFIITDWVNKLLNDQEGWNPLPDPIIESEYDITPYTNYVDIDELKYILFKYQDVFSAIQDLIKLAGSARYVANPLDWAGWQWCVTPDSEFLLGVIGNHVGDIETKWKTRPLLTPIVVKTDMITQNFQHQIMEANIVAVSGRLITPLNDAWCEDKDYWEFNNEGDIAESTTYKTEGLCSINLQDLSSNLWRISLGDFDVARLIGARTKPVVSFDLRSVGGYEQVIMLMKDWDNYFYYNFDNQITEDNKFCEINVEINPSSTEWVKQGTLEWGDVKYIGFAFDGPLQVWIDRLMIIGTVIRLAYDSTSIAARGAKFITIKDSLASTNSLDPDDDDNPLARQALGELLRNRVDILTGQILISLTPQLMGGQIVHIHASQKEDGTFQIDQDMRITEVKHVFTPSGAMTQLSLCDDLKNSIVRTNASSDDYNAIIKAVNPDFQSRTLASLKVNGDFDCDLTVIAKDYPS